jgi:hypothetical protein
MIHNSCGASEDRLPTEVALTEQTRASRRIGRRERRG